MTLCLSQAVVVLTQWEDYAGELSPRPSASSRAVQCAWCCIFDRKFERPRILQDQLQNPLTGRARLLAPSGGRTRWQGGRSSHAHERPDRAPGVPGHVCVALAILKTVVVQRARGNQTLSHW